MATSGTIAYALNARSLCTYALKKLREYGAGVTPGAEEMVDVLEELNLMLKGWQLSGPNLWRQTFGSVAMVASTASYALSPRPFRVIEARYRQASGIDIPMEEMNREDYVAIPQKTSTGVPTTFYVDYQRAETRLYVWPVPASVTTETVQYTFQRAFEDVTSLDQDIDIPAEYTDVIGYNLADRLQDTFGKELPIITRRAAQLLAIAQSADREAIVRFEPGYR